MIMHRAFLLVLLIVSLGCGATYSTLINPEFNIQLEGFQDSEALLGSEIWLLDTSRFVRWVGGKGLRVCRLDENGTCRRKIEYFACASRQPWQTFQKEPPLEERFVIVAVAQDSQIKGIIPLPKLTPKQIAGWDPLHLTGPIKILLPKEKRDLESRLHLLDSWQELHS
jgi:hypothetical protein